MTSKLNQTSYTKYVNSTLVIYHWYGFSGNTFVSSYPHQLKTKVSAIFTKHNTSEAGQCMALLLTYFDNPVWIRINCNAIYQQNSFICERNIGRNRILVSILRRERIFCLGSYEYIRGGCFKIVSLKELTDRNTLYFPRELVNLLTAWSLWSNRTAIVVQIIDRTTNVCICQVTDSLIEQSIKTWRATHCTCNSNQYALLVRHPYQYVTSCQATNYFICTDGTCILFKYQCDGLTDCFDNSDEINCTKSNSETNSTTTIAGPCDESMFTCEDKERVPFFVFCDGGMDCADGTDELACVYLYNLDIPEDLRATTHRSVLANPNCPFNWSLCAQSGHCYPIHMRCIYSRILDYSPLCPHLEHLNNCDSFQCPAQFKVIVKDSTFLVCK